MIQSTSSQSSQVQRSEQTGPLPQNEHALPTTISCTICDAAYAPSPPHLGLLQAPPQVFEAAFMSMCHFCFRCRRPSCPACWDAVHGVCGACVQEASLPFRVNAEPLNGVVFSPLRQGDAQQEDSSPPLLVCVRSGRFKTNVSLSTDPLKALPLPAAPEQTQLAEEPDEQRSRSTTQTSIVTPPPSEATNNAPEEPGTGVRFVKVVERIVTAILLIILLAVVAMIVLAEVSRTANTQILRIFNVDIRYEIAYLLSLLQQIHL